MQQIGRYHVLGELGRGAMGVVYRAQDPAIGRTIAIKTIRLSDLSEPAERDRLRERLFREAQSAGILSHPNIVTIYDILEEQGMAYIFMEMVNGPTLEKLLAGEEAPSREALFSIFRQTASALDYAHKKGIIHRDIKPANIMIDESGAAKITDFGVAKIASSNVTQSGMMMGTPSYMSPEQVQGGVPVDGRADEFALAVIAYEILTGEKPFVAEYLPSLLYKICREEALPAQRLNPTLPPEMDTVLQRGLAKSRDDRFPTCTEFIKALEAAGASRPDWVPLPRGTSQNLPTIGASGTPILPPAISTPVPAPPPAPSPLEPAQTGRVKPLPPAVQKPVIREQPQPAPVAPLPERPPKTHTVRNVLLALFAVIALAGLLLYLRSNQAPETATVQAPPEPVAPKPPDENKPTPVPPQEEAKPAEQPPAEETKPVEKPVEKGSEAAKTLPPVAPKPRTEDSARSEDVNFTTAPGGARILVDGTNVCNTPCSANVLKGRHVLVAKLDGYRDAQRIFNVPADSSMVIDMDRITGTLSVSSEPPGATLMINGQARPEKTPAVLKLPVGVYRLQIVKDTLRTDEETIDIRDGGFTQRKYRLE